MNKNENMAINPKDIEMIVKTALISWRKYTKKTTGSDKKSDNNPTWHISKKKIEDAFKLILLQWY